MSKRDFNDLRLRIVGGALFGGITIFAAWYNPDSFTMLLLFAGYVLGREWQRLNISKSLGFMALGYGYIVVSLFALYWLRSIALPLAEGAAASPLYLWLLFAMVWGTDIGAYFAGRLFGGRKLWPSVSPNKTVSGAMGGIVFACVLVLALQLLLSLPLMSIWLMVVAVLVSVAAQLGDLFQSYLKRRAGVKDSGRIIPGHGGLFDRIDGLMAAAPIFALMLLGLTA